MALDHSLTYQISSIKNIPHRLRLSKIFRELDKLEVTKDRGTRYIDIGCSNGYITGLIKGRYSFQTVVGRDHNIENLEIARQRHPSIAFDFIDLNTPDTGNGNLFQLITCFETLEHVGNVENALLNILNMSSPNGCILISVPIEVNMVGTIKFLAKTLLYGYKLDDLPSKPSWTTYLMALLRGQISKFRGPSSGWGTHFGFDYRLIDAILIQRNVKVKSWNYLTTRFYIIEK
jgi:2-polyprenyl-3-methyl-5-hydroxy-6-metoxy-1,4-benzoquinol methylase